jgi:hypothetical protein
MTTTTLYGRRLRPWLPARLRPRLRPSLRPRFSGPGVEIAAGPLRSGLCGFVASLTSISLSILLAVREVIAHREGSPS